jgi:tetratricopeptide (TPR) repeat protein
VAYDSILTKRRKQIHNKIARTIEEIYGENICDCYGVLANHCMACEDYEKGAEYARLEAKRLQKAASIRDAIEYAKRSITCLEQLPQTEANQKKLIDARTTLAHYYANIDFHCQAKEAAEPILDLAVALNYRKRLPAIYTAIGNHYLWVEEDSHKGLELIDKAMKIAEEVADYPSFVSLLISSGAFLPFISEFKEAHKRLQQSLDFSLMVKNKTGIAFSKAITSMCYIIEGKVNPAYEFAREALELAQETGDAFIKGTTYAFYCAACYQKGLFDEAKTHLLEWASLYERVVSISSNGWAYGHLIAIYFDLKAYNDAVICCDKIIQIMENGNYMPSVVIFAQSSLTRAKALRHDQDIELSELFAGYQNYKVTFWKGGTARNIGDILLNMDGDHLSDAEVWFQKAIEEDTRNGMRWQLASDHAFYADWFKKKGDIQGAKEQLTKAIDLFKECGADGWVTKTEQELASLT